MLGQGPPTPALGYAAEARRRDAGRRLAQFDATIYRELEAGDHTIVLLRLHGVQHADESPPLVFHRSGFGRLQRFA